MASIKIPLNTYGPTAGRPHMTGKPPRPKTVTVDFHNHMRIPAPTISSSRTCRPRAPTPHSASPTRKARNCIGSATPSG